MSLTSQELSAILVGLHLLEDERHLPHDLQLVLTNGDTVYPMTDDELMNLRERLNFGEITPIVKYHRPRIEIEEEEDGS